MQVELGLLLWQAESTVIKSEEEESAGGVEAVAERLHIIATAGEGAGEDLILLFVALLRAHGMLVRCVWCGAHPCCPRTLHAH